MSTPIKKSTPGKSASQNGGRINTVTATKEPIAGMVDEQRGKHIGKLSRFTLSVPGAPTFSAHIDPSDISFSQDKRIANLDVLTGVVIQDFGFKAAQLEIRGTTGSAYYSEMEKMNAIYLAQISAQPEAVTVTLEQKTYQVVWQSFSFQRGITPNAGNLVNYRFVFIVLSNDAKTSSDPIPKQTPESPRRQPSAYTSSPLVGISVADYIKSQQTNQKDPISPGAHQKRAIKYIEDFWKYVNPKVTYNYTKKWNLKDHVSIPHPTSWKIYFSQTS